MGVPNQPDWDQGFFRPRTRWNHSMAKLSRVLTALN